MKIYVSHKRHDSDTEFYEALRRIDHDFIFPHLESKEAFNSKELFRNKQCDVVLAEVSEAATGLGIELGWANAYGIQIICIYKEDSKISNSLKEVSKKFVEYTDYSDLTSKLTTELK